MALHRRIASPPRAASWNNGRGAVGDDFRYSLGPRKLKTIPITGAEFKALCDLRQKRRWDWPAAFGVNSHQVWGFQTFGRTPKEKRDYVTEADSPLLHRVADIFRDRREECGRFFIDERGASFKPAGKKVVQFVRWNSGDEKLEAPAPLKAPPPKLGSPISMSLNQLLERQRSYIAKK